MKSLNTKATDLTATVSADRGRTPTLDGLDVRIEPTNFVHIQLRSVLDRALSGEPSARTCP